MMKNIQTWAAILGVLLGSIVSGEARGDDMSIYDIDASVRPNVLIIFDNSTSMRYFLPYYDEEDYGDAAKFGTPGPFQNKDAQGNAVIYYQACCYDLYFGSGTGDPVNPCLPGRECKTSSLFDFLNPINLWARLSFNEAHAQQAFHQCSVNDWVECMTCQTKYAKTEEVVDCRAKPYNKYCCTPAPGQWTCYKPDAVCKSERMVFNGATFEFGKYHYEVYTDPDRPDNPRFIDVNKDGEDDRNDPTKEDVIRRYKGNYLNYLHRVKTGHPLVVQSRYEAAKAAVQNIINEYYNRINFGLMVFDNVGDPDNCADGGKIIVEISNPVGHDAPAQMERKRRELILALENYARPQDNMFTPLAEALADAGRYFRGQHTNIHPRVITPQTNYLPSPIIDYCQGCYVIVVTDGEPTCDSDPAILSPFLQNEGGTNYMTIAPSTPPVVRDPDKMTYRKYDGPNAPHPQISPTPDNLTETADGKRYYHFFDNVALYLYEKDMCSETDARHPTKGIPGCRNRDAEGNWPRINIKTFVIGFGVGNEVLRSAAFWGTGGRENLNARRDGEGFFRVGTQISLERALAMIVQSILRQPLITTNVAVSTGRLTSGDFIYIPTSILAEKTGGDLRKYKVENREIKGSDNAAGTDAFGRLKNNYFWSVNQKIKTQLTSGSRRIYTNIQSGTTQIRHENNRFTTSNELLTPQILGISGGRDASQQRQNIIDFITGYDIESPSQTRSPRNNILGSILHSTPVAVEYPSSTPNRVIFFGANDGMLHAINDANGFEMWAFIPRELLPNLKNLIQTNVRQYFVDGSPKVVYLKQVNEGGSQSWELAEPNDPAVSKRILIFGLRKGGRYYYGLDVTSPQSPTILWTISPSSPGFEKMGEPWSEPVFGKVKDSSGQKVIVGFIGGGYDPNLNENRNHNDGNGIYIFDVFTGSKVYSFTGNQGGGNKIYPAMSYPIPSNILAYDSDNDGYIDRLYVGDVGGQLWVVADFTTPAGNQVSNWEAQRLFSSRGQSNQDFDRRRIFYPPDLVPYEGKFYLYFGTGDREDPRDRTVVDRFYLVKDPKVRLTNPYTEADLLDVTNALQPSSTSLSTNKGWYIKLGPDAPARRNDPDLRTGEKVLARATIYANRVYFTTFTPTTGMCEVGGTPRLYEIHPLTAAPVNPSFYEATANPSNPTLTLEDRSKVLEAVGGIPSDPLILTSIDRGVGLRATTYASTGTGIPKGDENPVVRSLIPYSWRDKGANPGIP